MRAIFCMTVVAVAVSVGVGGAGNGGDARKSVFGRWKLVGFERGGVGQPERPVPVGAMTFGEGGEFTGSFPDHEMGGTVVIDPSKTPAAMDFAHVKAPDKGKPMFAIYKVNRDQLSLCAAPPGRTAKERPTSFRTRGTDHVLFVFERVK